MRLRIVLAVLLLVELLLPGLFAAGVPGVDRGVAEHVVVVVWDGMRPDFVTAEGTPNLYRIMTNGVFFRRHHSVYISTTEVNGAALATGATPGHNGILANAVYQPLISTTGPYATEGLDAIRRGDFLSGGHYIFVPTVAEILHKADYPTVVAGAKAVAIFQDRSARKITDAQMASVTLFQGRSVPRSVAKTLAGVNENQPFPPAISHPNTAQDEWTTKSLVKGLWAKGVPKYSVLWLSDPDKSQHDSGVGSPMSLTGIKASDADLGTVLAALEEHKVREKTDLLVVSDHGFSTISEGTDVIGLLRKQNFAASSTLEDPEVGDVLVDDLGGTFLLYVINHDEAIIRRLVAYLQTTEFAGVIFSALPVAGTFPLDTVGYAATPQAPDLMVSLRWSPGTNQYGAPGLALATDGKPGKGSHGSLSPFDMNNTLVAGGPDFKRGFTNDTPSGNLDIAPTVLWLLGVQPTLSSSAMDGRVLREAFINGGVREPKITTKKLEASHELGPFRWTHYLKYSEVEGTRYFDEGNGEFAKQ